MRLLVVFAIIVELQRFWVFADPKIGQKETPKVAEPQKGYNAQQDQSWMKRGFLSPSNSKDLAPRYQPRTEERFRPQEYSQYQSASGYMQRQDAPRHTYFQPRTETGFQGYTQFASEPQDSKYTAKSYREFSMSPKTYSHPEPRYNTIQSPQVNSEGYQVVNEDPAMHMAVVSPSAQYSQPQVITIRDNGQAYTSHVSQYRSQEPPITYENPEVSRSAQGDRYMSYASQGQQPEMQYKYRMPKSARYVDSGVDSSRRMEVLSNRRILGIVNQ